MNRNEMVLVATTIEKKINNYSFNENNFLAGNLTLHSSDIQRMFLDGILHLIRKYHTMGADGRNSFAQSICSKISEKLKNFEFTYHYTSGIENKLNNSHEFYNLFHDWLIADSKSDWNERMGFICREINNMHRTIQQSFWGSIINSLVNLHLSEEKKDPEVEIFLSKIHDACQDDIYNGKIHFPMI